jgi:hypothetical protein
MEAGVDSREETWFKYVEWRIGFRKKRAMGNLGHWEEKIAERLNEELAVNHFEENSFWLGWWIQSWKNGTLGW